MTYTIGLALEDFVPVILSGIGLFIISQMATRINGRIGRMATIGWALVFIGGLLKAVWKLIIAFTNAQTNIVWMDKGMFLWMSIGFTLLAFAVWYIAQIMRGKSTPQRIWVAPGIIIALILFAIFATGFPDFAINTWRFILLGMMTIG
ncbi:MAG: hypothetical protein GY943_32190, partial [Chloroflexi bacterium]|nr:hypothetical protein [Chloroflexota bacterium]